VRGSQIGGELGTTGYFYASRFGTAHGYGSSGALLGDLRAGAVDCALIDKFALQSALKGARGVKTLSDPLLTVNYSFVCAKEDKDLTAAIDGALATLRASDTLRSIVETRLTGGSYVYVTPEGVTHDKGALTCAIRADFPPYQYLSNDAPAGIDVDLARAVCDLLGVDVSFEIVEHDKLLTTVQYGKADFAAGALYKTDEDAEIVDFTKPYATCEIAVVVRNG
jgi:polar amino acid transport system substrate-binding protein